MEKINIAELLKDCPKGMELYSTIYGTVYFEGVRDTSNAVLIDVKTSCNTEVQFYPDGKFNTYYSDSEMTLFPSKDVRTWEGFVPPCKFKDGDIVYIRAKDYNQKEFIIIFKEIKNDHIHKHACFAYKVLYTDKNAVCHLADVKEIRLATEEEKQKLFDAIRANGYKWNDETKILEKLIEPKFKVGDKVKSIFNRNQYIIKELTDNYYTLVAVEGNFKYTEPIIEDKNWELVPNKFNIATLKPFDKVLVRDNNEQKWTVDLFSFYDKDSVYTFACVGHYVNQCIPYEENEHLLGTTNDCDEFYKNWE